MKRKIKRFLQWVAVCGSVCLGMAFSACAKENDGGGSSAALPPEYTLSLSKNELSLTVWEETRLFVSYDGTESVVWSIENPSIATVVDGVITGVSVGVTKITVTAGEEREECSLTVTSQSQDLFALETGDTNVKTYTGDSAQIQAMATYDGREVLGVEYSYYSYNDEVATVSSGGIVTAKELGQATIVVGAKIGALEAYHAVNVEVCPLGRIEIASPIVELSAVESVGGNHYVTSERLKISVYEKNMSVENATLVYEAMDDAQDVFTVNSDGMVTALNAGKAYLSVAYTGSDDVTVEEKVCVIVNHVKNVLDNEAIFVETVNESYTLDYQTLFGKDIQPTSAELIQGTKVTETEINGANWSITDVPTGAQTLNLKTRNIHYYVNVDIWTKEIKSVKDMEYLYSATDGRYRLANDLDMSGVVWNNMNETPFTGELDGQDYKISNLVQQSGLFNKVGARAKLQRIVLVDETLAAGSTEIGALCNIVLGTRVSILDVWCESFSLGQTNGGLIGHVEELGSVSVSGSYVRFFSASDEINSGAIVATCLGQVSIEDSNVISSSKICGEKTDSKNSLTAAKALNATKDVCKKAVPLEAINAWNVDQDTDAVFTLPDSVGAVSEMKIYNTSVFDMRLTDRQYVLSAEILDGKDSGFIKIWIINTEGEEFYYTHELLSSGILTQANCKKLLTATTETITLGENIDLSGIEWKPQTTFSGVLDGAGYTVSNLTSNDNGTGLGCGLFKTLKDATIKNLAIINHNVANGITQYGVLATNVIGTVTVENVVITSQHTPVNYGGMFRSIDSHSCKVSLKNVIMQAPLPSETVTAWGFIAGFAGKSGNTTQVSVSVENCYFIGGNGQIVGERKNYPGIKLSAEHKYYADITAFKNANLTMPTEFLSGWYEKL